MVIVDADFFSSFAKIERLDLITKIFGFIRIPSSHSLGDGELGCFLLAKKYQQPVLIDDRAAREHAKMQGIQTISVPSFILLCKKRKTISSNETNNIISSLKEKDNYEFKAEVKDELLREEN